MAALSREDARRRMILEEQERVRQQLLFDEQIKRSQKQAEDDLRETMLAQKMKLEALRQQQLEAEHQRLLAEQRRRAEEEVTTHFVTHPRPS